MDSGLLQMRSYYPGIQSFDLQMIGKFQKNDPGLPDKAAESAKDVPPSRPVSVQRPAVLLLPLAPASKPGVPLPVG